MLDFPKHIRAFGTLFNARFTCPKKWPFLEGQLFSLALIDIEKTRSPNKATSFLGMYERKPGNYGICVPVYDM